MGSRDNLKLSQVSLLIEVDGGSHFSISSAKMVSELPDLHMGYLAYLMTSSSASFFKGFYSSKKTKKQKSSFRNNKNEAT